MPDKEQLSDEELQKRVEKKMKEMIKTIEEAMEKNDKILRDTDEDMKELKKNLDDVKRSFEKTRAFKSYDKLTPEEREGIAKLVAEDHALKTV